jgi:RNA polymerase sigma-70 factor (ECF subfamily)
VKAATVDQVDSRELMARAQAGDTDAFGELYVRYRREVHAVAYQMQPRHVDDVVQDTFMRAFAAIHTWRAQDASVAAWLYTITRNLCRDRARRGYERLVDLEGEAGQDRTAEPEYTDPALLACAAETGRELRAQLEQLSRGQRQAITAYYLREVPIADIAQARGTAEVSVRRLLHQGRIELRQALAVSRA